MVSKNMKFAFLISGFLLFNVTLSAQNATTPYSFFVAGHTYGEPGVNNKGFHPPFTQQFGYIKSRTEIEFGVLTGDIVSPNPTLLDWQEIDFEVNKLGIPVYFAVGNHDMENRPVYESRYGQTYYSFKKHNDLFIILDPYLDGWNITGDQLIFLKDVLNQNANSSNNIFVFVHPILWKEFGNSFDYIKWNSDAGKSLKINFWTEIEPLFFSLKNPVTFFAGDLGSSWSTPATYDQYDHITLISSGMGGNSQENYLIVNVASDKAINYDLICLKDSTPCLGELENHLNVNFVRRMDKNSIEFPHIFPNPATQEVSIYYEPSALLNIKLFSVHGDLVFEKEFSNSLAKVTLNIPHLNNGIYIVKIDNGTSVYTDKLIIN
jgi:hypothetical protein